MQTLHLEKNSKERIICATLEIIKKQGMEAVSIRKIINLAKVNVAAVNYYFGSKDNIINEALGHLLEKANRIFLVLDDLTLSAEERLYMFIDGFIENILACPVTMKGSMSKMIKEEKLPVELIDNMKVNYSRLQKIVSELSGVKEDEIVKMKVFQLLSSIIHPLVLGEYGSELSGLDFKNKEVRNKYISLIINSIK